MIGVFIALAALVAAAASSSKRSTAETTTTEPSPPSPPRYDPKKDTLTSTTTSESKALVPVDKPAQQIVPQPPGATGNLPNETRPLGTTNFKPEVAHALAPQVYAALVGAPSLASTTALVKQFQTAADMQPADGVYGPRTAGALAYFLPEAGKPAPSIPRPFTADQRVIPYRI